MNILSKQQSDMIDMMLEGNLMTDIAKQIGVHRSTLYVWKDLDFVRAEIEERRRQLRKAARDKITGRANRCLDNIIEMADSSTDQRVRYNANKYLLDQCIGSPVATKEEVKASGTQTNANTNELKQELDNIKNLALVN